MISLASTRRLGPWLLGLFLLAQLLGVAPLLSAHTVHVFGSIVTSDAGTIAGTERVHHDHHHEHGDSDSGPQHHALHDMSGVLADALPAPAIAVVYVLIVARPPDEPATADPVLLERPPKSFLSV